MRRPAAAVILIISLFMAGLAIAGQFSDGADANDRGDDNTAFRLLKPLAEQGDAYAQYNIGLMYRLGKGVPEDDSEAAKWYRKAAEQGYADAQKAIGFMYMLGMGVSQDLPEAVKWFRKAAEQGHADGQNYLGLMYLLGSGVSQDYSEAVKWFRKAAEQGNPEAQISLGLMYDEGKGVPKDYITAYMWLNLSVSGHPSSDVGYGAAARSYRDRVASKMTPAQIAEAQKLAREWKAKKEEK